MRIHSIKIAFFSAIFLITSMVYGQNSIIGIVNYHENDQEPLSDVTVELFDANDNLIDTYITSDDGIFTFSVPSGEYYIRSSSSMEIIETVQADADLVLRYLDGTYDLNDYEFISADVNNSGNVTRGDYQLMINRILGKGKPYKDEVWEYDDIYVDFTSRDGDDTLAVWGTSTGDVEGIWMPGGRDIDLLLEEVSATSTVDNQIIELKIGSNFDDFIRGFNLNMTYPSNLIEIVEITGPDGDFQYNLDADAGTLKVIWFDENERPGNKFSGESLFKVKVKQVQNATEIGDGSFTLMEGGMVLDRNSNQIDDITIKLPKVTTTANTLEFELTSYPNPVANNLNFKITSPINNYANIYIYDLVGRIIQTKSGINIYVGTQTLSIETNSLPSGQYIYKVAIPNVNTFTGSISKTN